MRELHRPASLEIIDLDLDVRKQAYMATPMWVG
jgi:hypothetical protein